MNLLRECTPGGERRSHGENINNLCACLQFDNFETLNSPKCSMTGAELNNVILLVP